MIYSLTHNVVRFLRARSIVGIVPFTAFEERSSATSWVAHCSSTGMGPVKPRPVRFLPVAKNNNEGVTQSVQDFSRHRMHTCSFLLRKAA